VAVDLGGDEELLWVGGPQEGAELRRAEVLEVAAASLDGAAWASMVAVAGVEVAEVPA